MQVSHHKQGPVLYSSQGVFEAISDLEQVACGQVYGPPLSVLQKEVINSINIWRWIEYLLNAARCTMNLEVG